MYIHRYMATIAALGTLSIASPASGQALATTLTQGQWTAAALLPTRPHAVLRVEGTDARRIVTRLLTRSPAARAVLDSIALVTKVRWEIIVTERQAPLWRDPIPQPANLRQGAGMMWPAEVLDVPGQWFETPSLSRARMDISDTMTTTGQIMRLTIALEPRVEMAAARSMGDASLSDRLVTEWAVLLGHELVGHAYGLWAFYARGRGDRCPDPRTGEQGGCILRQENIVRTELGIPPRTDYFDGSTGLSSRGRVQGWIVERTARAAWCSITPTGRICLSRR